MSDDPRQDCFEDLYENAPCALLSISLDGKVVAANRTAVDWLGYGQTDLFGKRLLDILSIGGKVYWETHARPLLRIQGSVEGVALAFMKRAGGVVPAFGSAIEVRDAAGKPLETRVSVFRAAERRQFEQGLVSARKIEAEERRIAAEILRSEREIAVFREQFIAVLGHDLRNPLAGLVGGIRLLAREDLSERARKIIALMTGSADRMSELIDNVMDFAKARLGGGIGLDRKPDERIGPVLRQVVDELSASHPNRAIEVGAGTDAPVDCDAARVPQLVSNLVGNALTHGAADTPIRVTASATSGELESSVSNGGEPIPPEAMEKLFQPFFRGDVRESQQGLGLGLHIASEIARAHGGALTATSTSAETRLTFRMPIAGN